MLPVSVRHGFLLGGLFLSTMQGVRAQTRVAAVQSHRAGCPVILEGAVGAGESFHAPINSTLTLMLEAVPHGWIVRVLPTAGARPGEDLAALATPPFRSINPLLLTTDFGFRAQDVVGWNPRRFRYVRGQSGLPEAERAFRGVVGSEHPSQAEQQAVVKVASNAAEGQLEILDARLVPGTADQTAAAGLVATHFLSTAHTIVTSASANGPAGRVVWLRFRATFNDAGARGAGAARCR